MYSVMRAYVVMNVCVCECLHLCACVCLWEGICPFTSVCTSACLHLCACVGAGVSVHILCMCPSACLSGRREWGWGRTARMVFSNYSPASYYTRHWFGSLEWIYTLCRSPNPRYFCLFLYICEHFLFIYQYNISPLNTYFYLELMYVCDKSKNISCIKRERRVRCIRFI